MNLGGTEIWIILIVVVLLFGGSQIPKLARNIGQAQTEFKKGLSEGKGADGDDDAESDEQASAAAKKSDKKTE
jgi:sec-independent protein translocase protein TatA